MRRLSTGMFAVVALLWAQSAQAVPILWTLEDVTFLDGGAASGSFIFDADFSLYSSIGVSTTAGSTVLSGASSDAEHTFYVGSPQFLVMIDGPVAPGTRVLQLPFVVALSNAGGTVTLGGLFNFGEGSCGAAPCQDVSALLPFRYLAEGRVVGNPVAVSPVPEPSTLLLVTAGLAAARARRRQSAAAIEHVPRSADNHQHDSDNERHSNGRRHVSAETDC